MLEKPRPTVGGLALLITQAGVGIASLIIVGVAVAYITVLVLAARWTSPTRSEPKSVAAAPRPNPP